MDILQTHFRTVTTLGAYFRVGLGDEIETARLWVCCTHDMVAPPADPLDYHGFSQTEIVNNAIRSTILHPNTRPNVMTLGFKVLKEGSTSMHGIHGIENSFPNTIVTFLKSFAWQRLLDRLGTSAMMHLLCETSVFSELPNGCFFQITGCPLAELPITNSEYASDWLKSLQAKRPIEPSTKRKISPESHCAPHSGKKLRKIEEKRADCSIIKNNDVIIERYKIFYKHPAYDLSRNMMHGLPKNHMLNRFSDEKYIIHLLQRIFPRQFKLPSVFTTSKFQPVMALSQSKLDSVLEDPDALQKSRNVPFRLSSAKSILMRLLALNRKCDYKNLLNRFCAKKLKRDSRIELTIQNALTLCIPHDDVSNFVKSCVRQVIPHVFWGCAENKETVLRVIDTFVKLQRFESLSVEFLMKGLKITSCEWLAPPNYSKNPPKHVPPNDVQKRKEIFSEFIYWIMTEFVIPVISSNFYVTESASHKNRVFFFRHEDWAVLTSSTWKMLGQTAFRRMKEPLSKIMSTRTLSFSYVRLMPKTSGFRPIINLRRKIIPRRVTPKERLYAQSINSMLHNSFQILKYESSKILDESATVTGMSDVYSKLKCFQMRMRCKRPEKLYFVKADIVQCFDNINQEMLMDIIKDVISEEEYLVHKYSKAYANVGKIKKRFSKVAKNSAEFTQFSVLARQLSSVLRNVILTDGVLHSFEERDCLLALLEEHICNNLVKMGMKFYKQVRGIPQGSILSTLLCSLYLSHMEKNKLKNVISCNDLLLRLVDDFLFITPSKEKAIQFTQLLHEGVFEYGCTVNPSKTVVNFDVVQSGITLLRVENLSPLKERGEFPWCGLLINMKNLSVKVDYTRLAGYYIGESLTVEFSRRPWMSLQLKMFHYIIPKSHPLLLDTSMNSETVVLLNIYQNFLICGMKLHAHIQRILRTLKCGVPNAEFLMSIIQTTINYMQRLVHSRIKKKIVLVGNSGRQQGLTSCKLPHYLLKVEWLGFRAFARVLNRKQTSFKTLIEQLNAAQNDKKYDRVRRRLQSVSQHKFSKALDGIIY